MKVIPENHAVASEAVLMAGTTSSSVADLQVLNDGNTYDIVETGGTPGFDLHLMFKNILRFSAIDYKAHYDPGTHYVEVQLWNFLTFQWDTYTTIERTQGMNYRFIDVEDDMPYIRKGIVFMAFDHIPGGNASHRMFIDYAALVK